jgi:hypothetical protein
MLFLIQAESSQTATQLQLGTVAAGRWTSWAERKHAGRWDWEQRELARRDDSWAWRGGGVGGGRLGSSRQIRRGEGAAALTEAGSIRPGGVPV